MFTDKESSAHKSSILTPPSIIIVDVYRYVQFYKESKSWNGAAKFVFNFCGNIDRSSIESFIKNRMEFGFMARVS